MNFIEIDNKLINLDNVSYIKFFKINDTKRVVINFNYSVEMYDHYGNTKRITSYNYSENLEELENIVKSDFIKNNFIYCDNTINDEVFFINPKSISLIKLNKSKLRVIINLNYDIDISGSTFKTSSDFIYLTFNNELDMLDFYDEIKMTVLR